MYHLMSDIAGPQGSRELRAFAVPLGFRERWVQYPGSYREHFDVTERDAQAILARGDVRLISNRELGALLKAKRAYLEFPRL
jgi:hypothetical protein